MGSTQRKRRRCQHQPAGCWIRPVKRLAIYLRDGFRCGYCNRDLHRVKPWEITLDHLTCREKRGGNGGHNLITACKSCNSSRKSTPWRQFAGRQAAVRIQRQRRRALDLDAAETYSKR